MKPNRKRIALAFELYLVGRRLERARGRLQKLYENGVGNGEKKMLRMIQKFNTLCGLWTDLEEKITELNNMK